jgi:hypothetical protein
MTKTISVIIGSGAGVKYKVASDEHSQIANNGGT